MREFLILGLLMREVNRIAIQNNSQMAIKEMKAIIVLSYDRILYIRSSYPRSEFDSNQKQFKDGDQGSERNIFAETPDKIFC